MALMTEVMHPTLYTFRLACKRDEINKLGATRLELGRRPLPVIGEWRDSQAIKG
jgi:hypothetical protein